MTCDLHPKCKGPSANSYQPFQKKQQPRLHTSSFLLAKLTHAAPPALEADLRVRDLLMLRQVFDEWRYETLDHWPPHVTDMSILLEHPDLWHDWMQWVRLATGLGEANATKFGVMIRANLCEMLGCDGFGLRGASWGSKALAYTGRMTCAHTTTQHNNAANIQGVAMSGQVNSRPAPFLVLDMRTSCLARGTPAWRIMYVLRDMFDGWRLETFKMYSGAMQDEPKFVHYWMRWLQLARCLGWARRRPAEMRVLPQAHMTRLDLQLMQGLGLRPRGWPARQQRLAAYVGERLRDLFEIQGPGHFKVRPSLMQDLYMATATARSQPAPSRHMLANFDACDQGLFVNGHGHCRRHPFEIQGPGHVKVRAPLMQLYMATATARSQPAPLVVSVDLRP